MGADGSIDIYDREILETIVGKKFDEWGSNGHIYAHEIFKRRVITDYQGDNLWTHYCLYCGKEECSKDDNWENKYKVQNEHIELIKPALITNWEVWT